MGNHKRNPADGHYHIKNKKTKKIEKFPKLLGSRSEVMHKNAYKTSGNKTYTDFKYNKHGRIVSIAQSKLAKKNRHLAKAGYTFKKGVFGAFKKIGKTLKAIKSVKIRKQTKKAKKTKKSKK